MRRNLHRTYAYDRAGNLSSIDDSKWGHTAYGYDKIGRIAFANQSGAGAGAGLAANAKSNETFAFDPAHNLIDSGSASGAASSASSGAVANTAATSTSKPAAQNSAKSAPQVSGSTFASGSSGYLKNNRLEVFEDKRYRYDSHGNLIEKKIGAHTIIKLEWNVEHQLKKSTTRRNANDPKRATKQTTHYAYDAFGRRVEKRDTFGITYFTWDGNRLLAETRGARTLTYLYEPDSFAPLAQIERRVDRGDEADAKRGIEPAPAAQIIDLTFAEENPRAAAQAFQRTMLAKQREIKRVAAGGAKAGDAQAANAANDEDEDENDPDRTIRLKPIPGKVIRAALAGDAQSVARAQIAASASERAGTSPRPRNWQVRYFHNDHLGTPRELSAESGDIEWAASYRAWGNTLRVEVAAVKPHRSQNH